MTMTNEIMTKTNRTIPWAYSVYNLVGEYFGKNRKVIQRIQRSSRHCRRERAVRKARKENKTFASMVNMIVLSRCDLLRINGFKYLTILQRSRMTNAP